ncbi:MAG: 1,4-dihydroxy-6-naphthoate synthase [Nitrospirota bacterium]
MTALSLGYSPCPNDTFIFYALVNKKIDTLGLIFREILDDVETLNHMAVNSGLDVTKASFHAFGHLREQYCLLRSGGAIGKGCGPLVVSREDIDITDLAGKKIAIPGELTTAFLLLQIFNPSLKQNVIVMPFNNIMESVKTGDVDAGLIIHESRFTYKKYGLKQLIDLGRWWEEETGLPIPLGGILAKRSLGWNLIKKIDRLLKKSIEYAFSNRPETKSYIKKYSQEIEDEVIEQHINLYVNDYSIDIGDDGIQAVKELLERAEGEGIIGKSSTSLLTL